MVRAVTDPNQEPSERPAGVFVCHVARAFAGLFAVLIAGCVNARVEDQQSTPIEEDSLQEKNLPANLLRVSKSTYSGGEPRGDTAFKALHGIGIRTVVSVDGAQPDVEAARRHGLRCVHIPLGYDSIERQAAWSLVRLARESKAPVFVHCHHGRHRGPAAAAIVCLAGGELTKQEALQFLRRAGTSAHYSGLWKAVREFETPPRRARLPELVERADSGTAAQAMAEIDRAMDYLEMCRDAMWGVPPEHPDLVPANQALLVKEGFRESSRHLGNMYDQRYGVWLKEAESHAADLERALRRSRRDLASAGRYYSLLRDSCTRCHHQYRD